MDEPAPFSYHNPNRMAEPKTFYIIDGHAQIFRAYFAPFRDLTSSTGEPTKATYVFTQWLLSLAERRKPHYLAMVIDSGDESVFRKEIFPEYKANREPPPDDFRSQEERILKIVEDLGIPIFAKKASKPMTSSPRWFSASRARALKPSSSPRTRICASSLSAPRECTTSRATSSRIASACRPVSATRPPRPSTCRP